jgi:chemotaxis protein MotB
MRCGGWLVCGLAGFVFLGGCATLDDQRRMQAANRSLTAEKEAIAQELFDCRSASDSLRTRVTALDSELQVKSELIANLRKENELLDEMRRTAQGTLEDMAGRQALGQITISQLPEALDSALKDFAGQHPGAVQYDPARGTVKWKSDLLFALGSDVVRENSLEALQSFTQILMSPAAAEFEALVVGHTDNRPIARPETMAKHPTNWHLSAHRAISVAFALSKYGYEARRLGVMGYGENRPVADNASEAGASQNRRVEIYLIPRGAIVQASAEPRFRTPDGSVRGVALTQP